MTICPLCKSKQILSYHADPWRDYLQCSVCSLVYVPKEQHLDETQEKAEYDLHQNNIKDSGYRRFLSRLFLPLQAKLTTSADGLDFGCGPGPALSRMFEEAGYKMQVYDKFYANNPSVLSRQYDFICCTEVVEHLSRPGDTLESLFFNLKSGGWLGIMTKLVIDKSAFARWHYKNDLTHICFFSRGTFEWLANRWGCRLEFVDKDVILIQKPDEFVSK